MRTIEETWVATGEQVGVVDGPDPEWGDLRHAGEFFSATYEEGVCRAKLAAQAPAMARVLLDIEWDGRVDYSGDGGYYCCPSCEGIEPGEETLADAREDLARGITVVGHKADCALDACLRKAGVR